MQLASQVNLLLTHRADIDAMDPRSTTPIMMAAGSAASLQFKALLAARARLRCQSDIATPRERIWNPLCWFAGQSLWLFNVHAFIRSL